MHNRPDHRPPRRRSIHWLAALCVAFAAPSVHAGWRIVIADSAVVVIRGTVLNRADVGEQLNADDIVESASRGIVQLQDDAGNVLALGADTSILLEQNAHVSLLSGWLKMAHWCAGQPCAKAVIDTERGWLELADDADGSLQGARPVAAAAIVAAIPSQGRTDAAMFSESGAQAFTAREPRGSARTSTQLAAGQFSYVASGAPIELQSRPSSAFLADMPRPFRDSLQRVSVAETPQDKLIAPVRPVSYGDVSAWLVSDLPVRARFARRFRARLGDDAFRRDIGRNLSDLPEWRVLLYPPKQPKAQTPPTSAQTPPTSAQTSPTPPQPTSNAAERFLHSILNNSLTRP
jgi:hypothetical protein